MKRVTIAVLSIVAGLLALWGAGRVSTEIRRGKDWPTVSGKILERGVGGAMAASRTRIPYVKYTYVVAGREYTNDQVYSIRRTGLLESKVRDFVDSFPDPVPVFYNPENPADSYLVSNPMGTYWMVLGVAILALVLGALQLLVVLTKRG